MGRNLLNFETHVAQLARQRRGEVFFNSGPEKAAIVVRELFRVANESVAVYSGGLEGRFYNADLFDTLIDKKNIAPSNIKVIVSEPIDGARNSELIAHLIKRGVIVHHYPETGSHLILVDNDCYRFEHDHDGKKAFFAFGTGPRTGDEPPLVEKLKKTFDLMWATGEPVAAEQAAVPA